MFSAAGGRAADGAAADPVLRRLPRGRGEIAAERCSWKDFTAIGGGLWEARPRGDLFSPVPGESGRPCPALCQGGL